MKKLIAFFIALMLSASPLYATVSSGTCYGTDAVLMLHTDGTDGSTTFTDSSASAHTITAVADAQIDTAQSKFGGAASLFDGTDDAITAPDSANWDYGTGNFTIDFWIRFATVNTNQTMFNSQDGNAGTGVRCNYNLTATAIRCAINGSTQNFGSAIWVAVQDTWYHVAVTRSGTDLKAFVDGTQVGSTLTNSADITGSSSTFIIGNDQGESTSLEVNGWIDEFRVVKGAAIWTANFTPASSAYPDCDAASSSVKTYNGLAYASVKTVNGLAIASVKTRNGLA